MLRKSVSVEMVPCTDTATKAVFAERYDPETKTLSLAVTTAIQVKSHHLDQPLYLELALMVRTMHESDLHNVRRHQLGALLAMMWFVTTSLVFVRNCRKNIRGWRKMKPSS